MRLNVPSFSLAERSDRDVEPKVSGLYLPDEVATALMAFTGVGNLFYNPSARFYCQAKSASHRVVENAANGTRLRSAMRCARGLQPKVDV